MPLKDEVSGLTDALEDADKVPGRAPDNVGEKLTLIMHVALGARLPVQVFVWVKSPLTLMAILVTVFLLLLLRIAACAPELDPTS